MATRRIPLVTYEYNKRVIIGEAVVEGDIPQNVVEIQADRNDPLVRFFASIQRNKEK